jgi:hypothetical protein
VSLNGFEICLQKPTGIVNEQLKVVAFDISCFEVLQVGAILAIQGFRSILVNHSLIEHRWRF